MEGIQVLLVLLVGAIVAVQGQRFMRRRIIGFPLAGGFRGPMLPPGPMPYRREHWFRFGSRGRMSGLPFPLKRWMGPHPGHFPRPIIANTIGPGMAGGQSSSFGYRKGGDTTLHMEGPHITINTGSRDRRQGFRAGTGTAGFVGIGTGPAGSGFSMGGPRFIGAGPAGSGVGMGRHGLNVGARTAGTGIRMGSHGLNVGAGPAGTGIRMGSHGLSVGAGGIGTGSGIVNPGSGVGIPGLGIEAGAAGSGIGIGGTGLGVSAGGAGIGIVGVGPGASGAGIIMGPDFSGGGTGGSGVGGGNIGVGVPGPSFIAPRYTSGYWPTQGQQMYTDGNFYNNNPYGSGQSLMMNPGFQYGFPQADVYDASPITGRKQDQVSAITAQSSSALHIPTAKPVSDVTNGGYVLDIIPIGQQLKQDATPNLATKNVH